MIFVKSIIKFMASIGNISYLSQKYVPYDKFEKNKGNVIKFKPSEVLDYFLEFTCKTIPRFYGRKNRSKRVI